MSEPSNIIPPEFWKSLSDEEYMHICETGVIEGPLVERLYRMTDRHAQPPAQITPLISQASLDKWLRKRKPRKRSR